jgi:type VI secretion system protein VasJ
VLGLLKSKQNWNWTASGKHPVAKDYFWVGSTPPLLEALSKWVKNGYQLLNTKQNPGSQFYCWRFWVKGLEKNNLVCGIGRDSSDSLGRPYPLLIAGTGFLEDWEAHWELLPLACDMTWRHMEYVSAKRFTEFNQFEGEIRAMNPPDDNWSQLTNRRENSRVLESASDIGTPSQGFARLENNTVLSPAEQTEFFVALDQGSSDDPLRLAASWHVFLKTRIRKVPNAIFMGGAPQQAGMAIFKRPLVPGDFVRLWTLFSTETTENGSFITGQRPH